MEQAVEKKLDMKETKEMVKLLFTGMKVVKEANADGEINMADFPLMMKVIPEITPAIQGADKIIDEIKDMDEAEANDLLNYVATEVGMVVEKEKLVEQIIAGIEFLRAGYAFYQTF